ncbi:GNAT family N-acetyltransferase [Flavobacterium sp. DG1-102-2]|uniref:bifunctional helix-turn-helix transcriptional regulator/GNAT family N-acetyltransferase n=1 Tax=Flavobacterium sp. DG1-102-2 TaxID=3081663 RepID=UPI00294A20ED|nr:GNAT family N-acetyltransferase [Flavobacterium sp. DG1-102-2]MDV6167597.1 GNAT family N-acetyltransferase [Flavobacterium sp. DG1-102-2]
MDFFEETGKMAIGSRLRMLTDKVTEDAANIYKLYGVELQPKWFPVFHALSQADNTVTAIAQHIGHSHPSVSKIVGEMAKAGIAAEKKDKADGRRNVVSLTAKGKKMAAIVKDQYTDVNAAVEDILFVTRNDLWKAIEEWEFVLGQKSLLKRVEEQKKIREAKDVAIVAYTPRYASAFRQLNEEWISSYFTMEETDYKALDDPEGYILSKGGYIFVALYKNEPVGVCALIKMDDPQYDFELAKMAVSPKAQGKSIGSLLGQAVIEKARSLGASAIYLESNTILKPAISLYHKLGFQKTVGHATPYERCNIQMGLKL